MKNIVLGMIGAAVMVYLIVFCLSVYSITSRKNEVENCISQVLEQNLLHYYGGAYSDADVKVAVTQDLIARLQTDVHICDMKQGILSATIKEEFYLPIGSSKTIICNKTVIAEEEITETETEVPGDAER